MIKEVIDIRFGTRIKEIRELHGLTQTELAENVGMSRPNIANIEAGRQGVTLRQVEKFCEVYNIKPQNIMRGIWWTKSPKGARQ